MKQQVSSMVRNKDYILYFAGANKNTPVDHGATGNTYRFLHPHGLKAVFF